MERLPKNGVKARAWQSLTVKCWVANQNQDDKDEIVYPKCRIFSEERSKELLEIEKWCKRKGILGVYFNEKEKRARWKLS
jgi:hypothetical protein